MARFDGTATESTKRGRGNPLKTAIKQGRPVFGMYCDTLHPNLVELMAKAGLDFVILDTEHNGYGIQDCVGCVRAAEAWGITPLIRVYENSPSLINKALEIGAAGVVVPHVDTADLARQAVEAAKYPPQGTRGVHPFTRAASYAVGPEEWDGVWRAANTEVLVVLQPLESERGLASISEIASVPGVDLISLGLGDLSQVLGAPLRADDVRVRAAQEKARSICRQNGVATYALAGDSIQTQKWLERGVNVFVVGTDTMLFYGGCAKLIGELKEVVS